MAFFYEEMNDLVPLNAASFRSLSRMSASQRDAALASGTMCVQFSSWMADRFDLPPVSVPERDPHVEAPASAALHVRAVWGLGSAPMTNVLHTIEAHGIRVFALAAECREVDAFSFWDAATGAPFIIVGTDKTPERQVFDLAHELGHLVMHRDQSAPRGKEEEREANAFASSFLMPTDDLLAAAPRQPSFGDLVHAKHRWKVSVAALAFRMHEIGLITEWHYHRLCVQLAQMGRHREVESLPREQSQVLTKVMAALRAEGVTRADIARDLRVPTADLDALIGRLVISSVAGQGGTATPGPRPALSVVR